MPEVVEIEDREDHAYLGREFLTWLLYRVDVGEGTFDAGGEPFSLAFGGRARLSATAGDVTDAVLRGPSPAFGVEARGGVGAGRTVREAELRLVRGEREWRFTLQADTLDFKTVKLPALLVEPEDDRLSERLALLEELDDLVRAAFTAFLRERTRPVWQRTVVPTMRAWLADGLRVE